VSTPASRRDMKPRSSQTTILIVDDEPVVRALGRRILEEAGFLVFEAEDGLDALRVMGRHGPFHAVISDVRMPNMDGHALARYCARLPLPLPTLLVSGYDSHSPEGLVLTKPYQPADLVANVRKLIEWPRQQGRRTS